VLDHARRFENVRRGLEDALAELRDKSAGRLSIGANESSILYLLPHLERFRRLYPKIKVQVRRSQSSKIPAELLHGDLELGVVSYDPVDADLVAKVIFTDALAFVVSPAHRLARRKTVSIDELGQETFIAHNVVSPYREAVLREFKRHKVPLNMDVEMPTLETIRRFVQSNEGVAFLPRMCVQNDVARGALCEITVKELHVERKVRLLHAKDRTLSHAAHAFVALVVDVVQGRA
jgi:DNA-binding transcriptional LysR family regulator